MNELLDEASPELRKLEVQRHQILETTLGRLVDDRILEREAKRRDLTREELLEAELGKATVTDEEIDSWYEANKSRIRQAKEAVLPQIRSYLEKEVAAKAHSTFLATLRDKAEARIHLDPFRVDLGDGPGPVRGPRKAPVTLVEYGDFQCPPCRAMKPIFQGLQERYGERLRFAFRNYPIHEIHPQAQKAAEAALCAADQGKFWEMHDALFDNQSQLAPEQLKTHAATLKLDTDAFATCLDSDHHREAVLADQAVGQKAGVGGTPSVYVNGRPVQLVGAGDPEAAIVRVIEDELARKDSEG